MIALDLMIVLPAAFAVLAVLFGRWRASAPRWIALLGVGSQAALLASMASGGIFTGARRVGAVLPAATHWRTLTDGISTPLVVLTVFIGFVAVLSSWRIAERPGAFFGLLLALQAAVTGVFLADNILLFYVAWESVLIPMFFIIGGWGSINRRHAAAKFLIYTFGAGAVMLFGVILAIYSTGSESIAGIAASAEAIKLPGFLFWLLMVGFLVKVPVVPVHTWLPDAHTEAPTAGSIVLAGVMLKMGGYGILRLAIPFAPGAFGQARGALAILGIVGIVYGAAMALSQTDLKRLVAYSSVSHMGFVILAMAAATAGSVSAAMVSMVSHGLVAGLLFFLVGSLYDRTHTRDLGRLGGLGKVVPLWGVAFTFGALASLGLPGLSGFPGELVTLLEGYAAFGWWIAVAALGVVIAAAYNLRAIDGAVNGPVGDFSALPDLSRREVALAVVFSAAILVVGLHPALLVTMSEAAAHALARIAGGGA